MNLDHLQAIAFVQKLSWTLEEAKHDGARSEVAIFPPFTDLRSVQTLIDAEKFQLSYGAQDLSVHDAGAYTGEISGAFLSALGCRYVLVGHSERRLLHGETDDLLAQKVRAALRHGLVPVLCVGETSEDLEKFGASAVPVSQVKSALDGLPAESNVVIAYEPVWAIGSGQAATPQQAETVCGAIRQTLDSMFSEEFAQRTRVLYGGSVKATNIASFLAEANVDGALVGGASLDVAEFASISRFYAHTI